MNILFGRGVSKINEFIDSVLVLASFEIESVQSFVDKSINQMNKSIHRILSIFVQNLERKKVIFDEL